LPDRHWSFITDGDSSAAGRHAISADLLDDSILGIQWLGRAELVVRRAGRGMLPVRLGRRIGRSFVHPATRGR
jgi:hypothetical protein